MDMLERIIWNSKTRGLVLESLRCFPIRRKRILFLCWNGLKYGCNPKAISDKMLEDNCDFEIVYAFNEPEKFIPYLRDGIKAIKLGSLEYYYYLATTHFIISNVHVPSIYFPYKKSSQKYIYISHGSFGIKKIEFDSVESLSEAYLNNALLDTNRADLMTSNSPFLTSVLRSAYRFKGEILECGIPRNDTFFLTTPRQKEEKKSFFMKNHNIPSAGDVKFLLYTPTFRADGGIDMYGFDFNRVGNALNRNFGGEWYFLISSHPNMLSYYRDVYDFSDNHLVDVAHEDLQELMLFSDVLVTDYSSAEMDFMLLKKPVFQLCRDKDKYDRGFYIDPCDLPFPYAENDDELVANIESFDDAAYQNALCEFDKQYIGIKENGNATESVIDWIKKHS